MRMTDDRELYQKFLELKEKHPSPYWSIVERVIAPLKEEEGDDDFIKELEKEAGVATRVVFPNFYRLRLIKDIKSKLCGEQISPSLINHFVVEDRKGGNCSYETIGEKALGVIIKRIPFLEFATEEVYGRVYPTEEEIKSQNPFRFWERATKKVISYFEGEEISIRKKSFLFFLVKAGEEKFYPSVLEMTASDGYNYYEFEKKLTAETGAVEVKGLFQKGVYALLAPSLRERQGRSYLTVNFDYSDVPLEKSLYAPCLFLALLAGNSVLKRTSYDLTQEKETQTEETQTVDGNGTQETKGSKNVGEEVEEVKETETFDDFDLPDF